MKVLHLTKYFFPEYSGTTTRLYNLVTRLPFEIKVITSNRIGNGDIIDKYEDQFGSIKVVRAPLVPGNAIENTPILRYIHSLCVRELRITEYALKE